jgi:hypothetical protein
VNHGDKIYLMNNVRNVRNAAYDRIKRGEFPAYKIVWKSFRGDFVEARLVLPNGYLHSHTYTFPVRDVILTKIMEKKLEDYL